MKPTHRAEVAKNPYALKAYEHNTLEPQEYHQHTQIIEHAQSYVTNSEAKKDLNYLQCELESLVPKIDSSITNINMLHGSIEQMIEHMIRKNYSREVITEFVLISEALGQEVEKMIKYNYNLISVGV